VILGVINADGSLGVLDLVIAHDRLNLHVQDGIWSLLDLVQSHLPHNAMMLLSFREGPPPRGWSFVISEAPGSSACHVQDG
jgi:hypothetical protein